MNKYLEWLIYHKRQIFIIGGIVVFVLMLLGLALWKFYFHADFKNNEDDDKIILVEKKDNDNFDESEDVEVDEENDIVKNLVAIDIKGAVNNPGVYEIDSNSRVSDALNLAGIRNDADLSVINLSKRVFDEMVIIIYTKNEVKNFVEVKKQEEEKQEKCVIVEEKIINDACVCSEDTISGSNNSEEKEESTTMVSLNTATKEELMSLSGVGESKALLIIEYREANGGFKSIDEIKNIKGIGDSIFEKIKDRITV